MRYNDPHALANRRLVTDGAYAYVQEGPRDLYRVRTQQHAFVEVLEEHLRPLVFERDDYPVAFAVRIPGVVIDPRFNAGRMTFVRNRVPVFAVVGSLRGGDSVDEVMQQYGLTVQEPLKIGRSAVRPAPGHTRKPRLSPVETRREPSSCDLWSAHPVLTDVPRARSSSPLGPRPGEWVPARLVGWVPRTWTVSTERYSLGVVGNPDLTAGRALREARRRAGLTQVELARRAGVTQSVISAYESGHRQPALPTLVALVDAAGLELAISIRAPRDKTGRLTGPVGQIVRQRRRELVTTAASYGARHLKVFGSVARGEDRPDSDVDLLADLTTPLGLLGLGRLRENLEQVLGGIRVDLIPRQDLKPDVRDRVEREAVGL